MSKFSVSLPQSLVIGFALAFTAFLVHDHLSNVQQAGAIVVSLVASVYLAMSSGNPPAPPAPPATP